MRRASNLASTTTALYATQFSSRKRWFSTTLDSISAKVCPLRILVSVAGASLLFQEEAYAKKPPRPEFVPKDVVLYQYDACPFCNKFKAFLDYYDVPYTIVEVNPISRKEIKWSDYKKVPILMVDGEQFVDSSAIIDRLGDRISVKKSSKGVPDDDEEKKWRQWVDNHLVHMLSPNIYRNTSEALESFDYITSNGNFSATEKIYDEICWGSGNVLSVKEAEGEITSVTNELPCMKLQKLGLMHLMAGIFLPNLANLAVFGVLRPIRYLRSGKDMIEHTRIGEWYARMESAVGESSRINA